ncbi:dethiobiotin synthase [Allofrancisella guangzhouensis]|uniref:ATP-dependent dethiobiotin synthetase BioD n=1 Tax=Allofrancisella guangzhouensis TaxID=594679 RepID=A0A0A8E5U5_9GAMM|nr:dethiobiotin synthase [Allofrancisella guangzhouensis]AJC48972.1 ATP-dependent dethiobiotin synthetase BioD [Allofrancisella guangzhouensis]MBK2027877.1 dethiobiotin synthase [Allofrancisella guangzhouensis]MBK2044184.1 dethiobiotin synthase [Allofrancisella guangzhouensis]MBK2045110.1 dethiobiotin synthase [Allofrancisella guangzhouensis]
MKKFFIIGIDTEVGKTYTTTNLIKAYESQGINSLCLKPVASGKSETSDLAEDVESILNAYNYKFTAEQINLISFDQAIAPHIAAMNLNKNINLMELYQFITDKYKHNYDILLIEGAGGLLTPYSNNLTQLDLIKSLQIPVLLVSSIKVGCINHTLLTINELKRHNIKLKGWVANCNSEKISYIDEQIQTIEQLSGQECLAKIAKNSNYQDFIELSKILISPDEKV